MSPESSNDDLGWKFYDLKREVYLGVPPVFEIDSWTLSWMANYESSELRRWPFKWSQTRARVKIVKAAKGHAQGILTSGEPTVLHLEPLVPLFRNLVEHMVEHPPKAPKGAKGTKGAEQPGDPQKKPWDPQEVKEAVLFALDFIGRKLTDRQQEAFHLQVLLGMSRQESAAVMKIKASAVSTYLCEAWTALENEKRVDVNVLKWFLTSGINVRDKWKPEES